MSYISVLNFLVGEVDIITIGSEEDEIGDYEDYLKGLGYNLNEICYMVTDNLKINFGKNINSIR